MRMELSLENGRPVAEMDDQGLDRALVSATGLLNLNPTQAVRVTLAQFIAEAQRELNKRPGRGYELREAEDFTNAELDAAITPAPSAPPSACRPTRLVCRLPKSPGNERPMRPRGPSARKARRLAVDTLVHLPAASLQSVELDGDAASVSAARSFVMAALRAWAMPTDTVDMAELLTSELATNALIHGSAAGGTFTVEVRSYGCCVGIEVSDHSLGVPVVRVPASEMEHGRGLLLVARVANSWGYYFAGDGRKHVWFHLRVDAPTLPPADTGVAPAA
jgi:anti-sigma regulatory factor (Ser/Thr protein kinase)